MLPPAHKLLKMTDYSRAIITGAEVNVVKMSA